LKDQEIANADMVAWDGDGVGGIRWLRVRTGRSSLGSSTTTYGNVNLFPPMMVMMMRASKDTISRMVQPMTEGVVVTIFIVVTHLVLLEAGTIYGLFGNADLFSGRVLVVSWDFEARRVDGLLGDADFFSFSRTEAWRVNGSFADSNFFSLGGAEAWRVNGGLVESNFFSLGRTEAWRVDGGLVDSNFFTIGWLEARSVFTLGHVNLSLAVMATRYFDGDVRIVVSSVWKEVWEVW
jgi:hypothetical protein